MEYNDLLYSQIKYDKLDIHKPIRAINTYLKHFNCGQTHETSLWSTTIYTDGRFDRYGEEDACIDRKERYFQSREVYIKDCSYIVVYQRWNLMPINNSKITFYMINPHNVFLRKKIKNALLNNKCNIINIEYSSVDDVINCKDEQNKKTNLTNAMEELEKSLIKLKTIAPYEYDTLNREYQSLLASDDKVLKLYPLLLPSIIILQNKVDTLYSEYGGEPQRILSILKNENKEMINILRSKGEIDVSLQNLDSRIDKIFKENAIIDDKIRNDLLNQLSQLYFLYLYVNKENVDSKNLMYSFAYNNIKRIQVAITLLENNNVIAGVPYNLLDINSIDELIVAIKQIEFMPLERQEVNGKIYKKSNKTI